MLCFSMTFPIPMCPVNTLNPHSCMQQLICIFDSLLSRRIDAFQRILITEFFPFVCTQCVIGENLYFLYVVKRLDKCIQTGQIFVFVASLRH